MNQLRKISLISCLILIAVISTQILFLHHMRIKRKIMESDIQIQKEKIADTAPPKTEKNRVPLKHESHPDSFLTATHLARAHQLSVLELQLGPHASTLKIILKGSLKSFISFLQNFSKKLPGFRLTHINISTNEQLQFELECEKINGET
jgi:hypothetical protein